MALWTGRTNNSRVADLIAKCITEKSLLVAMEKYIGTIPGEFRYVMNPTHFYNSNNIDNEEYAKNFYDGWVYPNGTYITKQLFPEMYEKLAQTTYPIANGYNKTFTTSSGLSYIILPNISERYFYADNTASKTISNYDGEYTLAKHKHSLNISGDKTQIKINNGAWIWSTEDAGGGSIVDSRPYGEKTIPKTGSAHSGSGKTTVSTSTDSLKKLTWDIPVTATATTQQFKSDGGNAIPEDGYSIFTNSSEHIHPTSLKCCLMMFIGFPNIQL